MRPKLSRFRQFAVSVPILLISAGASTGATVNHDRRAVTQSNEATSLEAGKPVERELSAGQTQTYKIHLAAGEFLKVSAEQRGINLALSISTPDSKQFAEVDNAAQPTGVEEILFIAEAAGDYQLKVRVVGQEQANGRYEIKIKEQKAATAESHKAYGSWLSKQVEALVAKRQVDAAFILAQRAVTVQEKALGSNNSELSRPINDLGILYLAKGDANRAGETFKRALAILEKSSPTNYALTLKTLNLQASTALRQREPAQAERFLDQALSMSEKMPPSNDSEIAASLESLTATARAKGDGEREARFLESALKIREKALGSDDISIAQRLNVLGLAYQNQGAYARAESSFERALVIVEKQRGGDHPDVAAVLNNLAGASIGKGDYNRAEPLLQRSLMIREKRLKPEDPLIAQSLDALGKFYYDKYEYQRALPLLKRALEIREKAPGSDLQAAITLNILAAVYLGMGDLTTAEPLFQRALTIYEKNKLPESMEAAQTTNNLAVLTLLKGDYAKAETLYQRALDLRRKTLGPRHPQVAKTLDSFAVLYDVKGDIPQAVKLRNEGLEIREYNLGTIIATGSEEQKRAYITQPFLSDEYDITLSLNARSAPRDPQAARMAMNLIVQRKGRVLDALTDSIGALRRRLDPQDRELLDRLAAINSRLSALSLTEQGGAGYQAEIARLEAEKQKIGSAISAKSAGFGSQSQTVTLERVQKLIPADTALVEIATYRPFDPKEKRVKDRFGAPHYSAYVLKSNGLPSFVELGEAATIDREVDALRKALRNRRRADVKGLARQVDRRVMQPIRTLLGETRNVLISPDGSLNLIPFAALVDEHNHYLVSQYSFTYLSSGRDLLRLAEHQPSKQGALIVANPTFGDYAGDATSSRGLGLKPGAQPPAAAGAKSQSLSLAQFYFRPLPGTASEALALKTLLPQATLLTKDQATESAVKQVSGPKILHVATHGFFLGAQDGGGGRGLGLPSSSKPASAAPAIDPLLRSGLALAGANQRKSGSDDGILTALEVTGLDLQGTQLVVLSACDTGVGEIRAGDGVYGLRRALVLAGSESQLISLWPVSDIGTRDLMVAYYQRLNRGLGRNEALRKVQLQMLKSEKRRHPFYWASFIQSGEWGSLK